MVEDDWGGIKLWGVNLHGPRPRETSENWCCSVLQHLLTIFSFKNCTNIRYSPMYHLAPTRKAHLNSSQPSLGVPCELKPTRFTTKPGTLSQSSNGQSPCNPGRTTPGDTFASTPNIWSTPSNLGFITYCTRNWRSHNNSSETYLIHLYSLYPVRLASN